MKTLIDHAIRARVADEEWPGADLRRLLTCPDQRTPLAAIEDLSDGRTWLTRADGVVFPIVNGIPRMVRADGYSRSFSYEWNAFRETQLDSRTRSRASEAYFTAKTGLTPADVEGRLVLDAGIGAGRFTDVLLRWGARVVGVDLSYAVEAAALNFGAEPRLMVVQADLAKLPFADQTFDLAICIGVLHHTPNPVVGFREIARCVKPGGKLAVWVYPNEGDYVVRKAWIGFTSRIPHAMFHRFCKVYVPWLLRHKESRWAKLLHRLFPISDQGHGLQNDILDTFDGYSPRYHSIHSEAEVRGWFEALQFCDVTSFPFATAVCGRKPDADTYRQKI